MNKAQDQKIEKEEIPPPPKLVRQNAMDPTAQLPIDQWQTFSRLPLSEEASRRVSSTILREQQQQEKKG